MDIYLETFKKLGVKYIVSTKPLGTVDSSNSHITIIEDARSAAFYAMGQALKTGETVLLSVPGEYLTNIYTAVTEAWFQKVNIIILAEFQRISEVNTSYMDRCVLENITCGADEFKEVLSKMPGLCRKKGPLLFSLVCKREEIEKVNYSYILIKLSNIVDENTTMIFCYNPQNNLEMIYKNVCKILSEHKYGVLSKYIGSSMVSNVGILCCTAECMLVDVNILRTRYINSNMKIILLDSKGVLESGKIDQWIRSNHWDCMSGTAVDMAILEKFYYNDKPTILIIK